MSSPLAQKLAKNCPCPQNTSRETTKAGKSVRVQPRLPRLSGVGQLAPADCSLQIECAVENKEIGVIAGLQTPFPRVHTRGAGGIESEHAHCFRKRDMGHL